MFLGYLKVQVLTANGDLPVADAQVIIKHKDGRVLYDTRTDDDGNTDLFEIAAPDKKYTLDPNFRQPAYSVCDVEVRKGGFISKNTIDVEIVDTQTTILPVLLHPLEEGDDPSREETIIIPPVGLLEREGYFKVGGGETPAPEPNRELPVVAQPLLPEFPEDSSVFFNAFENRAEVQPLIYSTTVIPDYITVHLGIPTNASARNVRVKFSDYIKNVVSSEIYSTWPLNSLISNIHVIVSFALNRVFTEWYRSRGFNFDITNSTAYDQYFRDGGPIFQNISQLVDKYFNVYARRIGFINPFFTQFCNGTTVTCPGLSQWGTVTLANQGLTPIEILRYYYPRDIELVTSYNITSIVSSYPGYPLRQGSTGDAVRRIQNFLNRIRVNFPLIPRISSPDGIFGAGTDAAVRSFQRSFNLAVDGIVGSATWYKLSFIYVGVTRLAELDAEGERVTIGQNPPNVVLQLNSRGADVIELQFILNTIAAYYDSVPPVIQDGVFDASTRNAVIEFQKTFGLVADGTVGVSTWNKLYAVYRGIDDNIQVPPAPVEPPVNAPPFLGELLRVGSVGINVRTMQAYLNTIAIVYPSIPLTTVDGIFGTQTEETVKAFQHQFLLMPDGIIGPITWNKIVEVYLLVTGNTSLSLQYPGTPLRVGSTGSAVRTMQLFLSEIRAFYPSLPAVTVDGIFGSNTENAVRTFQQLAGLTVDGIIGPVTWYAIIEARNTRV